MTVTPRTKRAAAPLPMPRQLFDATTTPDAVTVPARTVLALDGRGRRKAKPSNAASARSTASPTRSSSPARGAGRRDSKIGPLEARWWTDEPARRFLDTPRAAWRWQLRMAVPENLSPAEVARAVEDATHQKGGKLEGNAEAARVAPAVLPATRYGRVLHIGPYATEAESFARIVETVEGAGLVARNAHLEVYLSDPRRTKPEKLKTVLLLELA